MRIAPLSALALVLSAGAVAQTNPPPAQTPAPAATPGQPATGQAPAAAPASPTPGAVVYGAGGAQVGTVDSVTPQGVVINTGTARVAVPTASIGTGPNGLTVSLTREQLTAAASQAQAAGAASLTAGTSVKSSDGVTVGSVKAVDDQFVTLTTTKGADVRLPKNGIANGPTGAVIGLTGAQFEASTAGAATAGSDSGSTTGAAGNAAAGTGDTTAAPSATSSTTTTTKRTTRRR